MASLKEQNVLAEKVGWHSLPLSTVNYNDTSQSRTHIMHMEVSEKRCPQSVLTCVSLFDLCGAG